MKRGFTLIELLVVIAIIGLLSTLSVVSFSSAKEKARLARASSSSEQILRTMGDDLIGRWDFDECSGTAANDLSENQNNAAITGAVHSTDTLSGKGCSLVFDGNSFVDPSKPMNISWSHFTITASFKSTDAGDRKIISNGVDFSLQLWNKHMRVVALPAHIYEDTKNYADGKWHTMVAVGDSKSIRVYMDGNSNPDFTLAAYSRTGATDYEIGRAPLVGGGFLGQLDDVRIYDRSIAD
jgi:prepilin-type N-terminal cleavage/methylation domain-containing protein